MARLAHAHPLKPANAPGLLACLATVHDPRRAVAVDGKTLRGAKRDGRQVHLLAAMDHAPRAVLAQRQINGAPGEVPAFQPMLAGLDLTAAVVTADALHPHADAAEFLVTSKQAITPERRSPAPEALCPRPGPSLRSAPRGSDADLVQWAVT